ncbi:MAG: hypothetical protein A3G33_11075 [Omnitrophica bacterium RIFCSPLOWO2_12_FULL_44_17]|uniref:Cytochrome c domain-containing protein n=1 Tax=Candidatus Danuiimicrobium aquiferis TaxID=1801832 RepID=A0A1G1KT06_9BACT|nr:MAG: hypothetical protein A3B72_01255 [Omnitrophica bacterium RIFCSPHIGHO2_02_FULL_45_28]OGW96040.1 MAG: hypothetical protein A3G33_11075 [Omnitrophica bacterium RIFCSPLOWO2_12_FULL_44_17]OGX02871.1 MAG: hypothetical protein A3J12_05400 [Omnitrophica bacterium RIFCSPLOWO2_02_FULL_44_11]
MIKKIFSLSILMMFLFFIFPAVWASTDPTKTEASSSAQVSGVRGKGSVIFSENCAACHTLGVGDDTVPDLRDVTLRRAEAWLKGFIQFPSKMFEAKDPIAMELLAKYKEPMSDPGLTSEEVDAVIEYLKEAAPASKPTQGSQAVAASSPLASGGASPGQAKMIKRSATKEEVDKGRALFQGTQRFSRGGPSCFACHDLGHSTTAGVGHLAKELAAAYSCLGEARLRAILEKAPFPLMREAYGENPLTADEISDLNAFLEQAGKEPEKGALKHYGEAMPLIGLASFAILLGLYGVFWFNRKSKSVNEDIYDRQTKSEEKL